jgi:hypothetical protein
VVYIVSLIIPPERQGRKTGIPLSRKHIDHVHGAEFPKAGVGEDGPLIAVSRDSSINATLRFSDPLRAHAFVIDRARHPGSRFISSVLFGYLCDRLCHVIDDAIGHPATGLHAPSHQMNEKQPRRTTADKAERLTNEATTRRRSRDDT